MTASVVYFNIFDIKMHYFDINIKFSTEKCELRCAFYTVEDNHTIENSLPFK